MTNRVRDDLAYEIQILNNLYMERSQVANQHSDIYLSEIKFYFTLIVATITIPFALKQLGFDNELFLSIFSIVGIFFCFAGLWCLVRERYNFHRSLYAISRIREYLKQYCPNFMNYIGNDFESIGIHHIDLTKFPTLNCYLTKIMYRIKTNDNLFKSIYVIFIIIHIFLIFTLYQ